MDGLCLDFCTIDVLCSIFVNLHFHLKLVKKECSYSVRKKHFMRCLLATAISLMHSQGGFLGEGSFLCDSEICPPTDSL